MSKTSGEDLLGNIIGIIIAIAIGGALMVYFVNNILPGLLLYVLLPGVIIAAIGFVAYQMMRDEVPPEPAIKYSTGPAMRATISHEVIQGEPGIFKDKPPKYAVRIQCEFTREEVAVILEQGIGDTVVYQELCFHKDGEQYQVPIGLASFARPLTFTFPTKVLAAECDDELVTKVLPKIKAVIARSAAAISKPQTRTIEL